MEPVIPDIDSPSSVDKETEDAHFGHPPDDDGPAPAVYHQPISHENIDADAIKVLRRLTRNGYEAYLVGGSVRDLLLGRKPKDFDIATSAKPQQVRALFRNCRVIGRRFRLAHILFAGGKIIEVATFRRDPGAGIELEDRVDDASNGEDGIEPTDLLIRHDNVFGVPHEDAKRRDFTMNGLFYDLERGEVIDYVGGLPDIRERLVRTIGYPDVRIREDPVRILRAIKFSARLDMGIDPELYDALVDHRLELTRAARPRVLEEVLRLLRGGAAHRSIWLLWDTGVLSVVLPELASYLDDEASGSDLLWGRLDAIDRRRHGDRLPTDAVLLASLLLGPLEEWVADSRDPSTAFEDFFHEVVVRLAVPRRMKDRIRLMMMAQRRLAGGRLGGLPRRDFFADAATMLAIDHEARGLDVPDWAIDPRAAADGDDAEPSRGRRRRRRRR